jgi:hypothetical protein
MKINRIMNAVKYRTRTIPAESTIPNLKTVYVKLSTNNNNNEVIIDTGIRLAKARKIFGDFLIQGIRFRTKKKDNAKKTRLENNAHTQKSIPSFVRNVTVFKDDGLVIINIHSEIT